MTQQPYLPTPNQGASRKRPAPFLRVPCLLKKKRQKTQPQTTNLKAELKTLPGTGSSHLPGDTAGQWQLPMG